MTCDSLDFILYPRDDRLRPLPVIEKGDMLLPGQADHDAQTVFLGLIQKPSRRGGVGANRIHPTSCDCGEVPFDDFRGRITVSVESGTERTVCDAANPEFLFPDVEEFSSGLRAMAEGIISPFIHRIFFVATARDGSSDGRQGPVVQLGTPFRNQTLGRGPWIESSLCNGASLYSGR